MKKYLIILLVGLSVPVYQSSLPAKEEFLVKGRSMEPTLHDREEVLIFDRKPEIYDIVVFKCQSFKCEYLTMVKRVTDIKDGCYFFEGDNKEHSFDSRDYGWLCGDELELIGVVK